MTKLLAALVVGLAGAAVAQPVAGPRYDVTFTRAQAVRRTLHVEARFTSDGSAPVVVSLPAWTPGAYELSWYARNVTGFAATSAGSALRWEKVDHDTWSIQPNGAREVTIAFDYRADSLDNAMSWAREDFAFFNGTNVLLHREGTPMATPASLVIHTEPEWQVATGMRRGSARGEYVAADYHELVDMPFFVGAFDLDSMRIADRWVRLATYPRGKLAGDDRRTLWDQVARTIPPMVAVFGDQPYTDYTNLLVFDEGTEGGSALEHSNSHLGIYTPFIIGNPALPSITAHEIFHLWNVKRMRPGEMWPYRYDVAQPTTLLWVSEGITDYYADIAQLRGGVLDSLEFLDVVRGKMEEVEVVPPVALADASLSTWIHPVDGTAYIYYPKGSLVGLLLDILIRDASNNAAGLDQVMRDVYDLSFKRGRGFSSDEFWAAASRAAGGQDFTDFAARYISGREPLPYSSTFARAGIRLQVDSTREPRLGLYTEADSSGVRVTAVDPGSSAEGAGVRPGDYLLVIGDVTVTEGFGERFRARHGRSEGREVTVKIRREGAELTLPLRIQMAVRTTSRLVYDEAATPRARRVRAGLLTGRRGG